MALLALLVLTLIRLFVAGTTPLSEDEAYYWVWSHALAPGFLDHPPMVALWVRAGTWIAGEGALGVRLLAPLSAAAGSVLVAQTAELLFPGRRLGLPAAALLNGTLLVGAGAVTMTPDTPLLLFWAATLWALARLLRSGDGRWWLAVGVFAGCAAASKYTGGFLGLGIVLWLLWVPGLRRWFRSAFLWLGGAVAAAVFAPVVLWNAEHGWASFAKQGGRTGNWDPGAALRHLSELLGGQAGLATPLVFILLSAGVWVAVRRAAGRDPAWSLLAALTVPGLLVFVQHAIGDRVQANWPAIVYPAAAVCAAGLGWRLWRPAVALGLAVTAVVYVQGAAAPFPLPRRLDPILIRLGGWDGVSRDLEAMRQQQGVAWVASEAYGLASLVAWRAPPGVPVLGAEDRWRLFRLPQADSTGPGLLLVSQRRSAPPDPAYWATAQQVGQVVRTRGSAPDGVEAERFRVYRVTQRPGASFASLPHPGEHDAASDP
jgi:4-amino-4-deoxy-L-arabinose transferase-like glycosyltransferase